nr:hypothetical protein [uncultured bacterium]
MNEPSEMDILRQLAKVEGIDAGSLFISGDVVYRLTGETVTGTVCQVGTPFWIDAVTAAEIQLSIDDPRPSVPHDVVMDEMNAHIVSLQQKKWQRDK